MKLSALNVWNIYLVLFWKRDKLTQFCLFYVVLEKMLCIICCLTSQPVSSQYWTTAPVYVFTRQPFRLFLLCFMRGGLALTPPPHPTPHHSPLIAMSHQKGQKASNSRLKAPCVFVLSSQTPTDRSSICWKFLPVQAESFLPTVASVLLRRNNCDKVKIWWNLLGSFTNCC